ncbi:MAG TPA: hypothetical protein VN622_03530, partial [Clostridia bacterium]|nr:hypothetical protein [Clostridia bacterium]
EWHGDLLGGVLTINGKWQDGKPMLAIPNYARMNRVEPEPVETAAGEPVNYAPGATASSVPTSNNASNRRTRRPGIQSLVWMKDQA